MADGEGHESGTIVQDQSKSVAASNLKSLGDGPAFYHNLAMGNAVANQQAVQQVGVAVLGKICEMIVHTSPSQGGADVAALQQLMKGAMTTPPVTAPPPATGG